MKKEVTLSLIRQGLDDSCIDQKFLDWSDERLMASTLDDLDADSLDVVELIMFVERESGITFSEDKVDKFNRTRRTIQDFINICNE